MPLISVIVPVYNSEKYLHRCIDSILTQTFSDFELLLVDDGSTDSSGAICDEYAKKDQRVRVFHKENGGVSSARNLGLDKARGEWIAFVDADDELMTISIDFNSFMGEEDLIIGGFIDCPSQIEFNLPTGSYSQDSLNELYSNNVGHFVWGSVCGKLFKRSLIGKEKFDLKMTLGEDELFFLQYLKYVRTCKIIDSYKYKYYTTPYFYEKHSIDIENAVYSLYSLCKAYDELHMDSRKFKMKKFLDFKKACQRGIKKAPSNWYKNVLVKDIYESIKQLLPIRYRLHYQMDLLIVHIHKYMPKTKENK